MRSSISLPLAAALVSLLLLGAAPVWAQTLVGEPTDTPTTTDPLPEATDPLPDGGDPLPDPDPMATPVSPGTAKVAGEYRDFLGADAETVVSGLREGKTFTLTDSVPGDTPDMPGTSGEIPIDPATGKMGYGNVRHTLSISRFLLQGAGVEQPTAQDLQSVLNGGSVTGADGTVTEFDGILALRSEGMGWGQIAKQYGVKLGHIKNGRAVYVAPPTQPPDTNPGDVPGEFPDDGTGTVVDTDLGSGDGGVMDDGPVGDDPDVAGVDPGSADVVAEPATSGESVANAAGKTPREGRGHRVTDAGGQSAVSKARRGGKGIVDATGNGVTAKQRGGKLVDARGARSGGKVRGRSIVDASGAVTGSRSHGRGHGIVDASGAGTGSRGHGRGKGIVDASGALSGSNGHGRGKGIVSAMGSSSSGRGHGVVNAMGSGSGSSSFSGGGRGHGIVNAVGGGNGGGRSGHVVNALGKSGGGGKHGGHGKAHGKHK